MIRLLTLLTLAFIAPMIAGCSSSGSGSAAPPAPVVSAAPARTTAAPPAAVVSAVPLHPAVAPTWQPGDRWTYLWTSGKEQGSKTVEVREVKDVNGVRYYVVRNAEADHYWTLQLHWAGSVRDSKVEARMVPPEPWFTWPLQIGQQWQHRGEYEQAGAKKPAQDVFVVVGTETVAVPAGTFQGFKITRTGQGGDTDEYWYVPEVRSYVRWIGRRGSVQFEELLSEYRVAGAVSPSTEPPRPPSSLR
jgi:hypothetical protein